MGGQYRSIWFKADSIGPTVGRANTEADFAMVHITYTMTMMSLHVVVQQNCSDIVYFQLFEFEI